MKDWIKNLPIFAAIAATATGLKMIAEKQMQTAGKIHDAISLLEKIKIPDQAPEEPIGSPVPLEAPPMLPDPPKPQGPKQAPKAVKRLVMHTMNGCRWCVYDRREILPAWIRLGYNVEIVDEKRGIPGSSYPWYEIWEENATSPVKHIGSLSTYK